MRPRFRLPLYVVAVALLGTIALLATLQYRWLGRISDAERQRMTANLGAHSTGFAQEFDREITRASVSFQLPAPAAGENVAARLAAHYERWTATARFPRLVKDVYLVSRSAESEPIVQRFSPVTRFLEPAAWPDSLAVLRNQTARPVAPSPAGASFVIRSMPSSIIESAPALVIPTPVIFINEARAADGGRASFRLPPALSYVVLLLDRDYMTNEMLPTLMQQYFRASGSEADYQVAVVSVADKAVLYKSGDFAPDPSEKADASTDLFQVRLQEFGSLASEVRRFSTLLTTRDPVATRPSGGKATHEALRSRSPEAPNPRGQTRRTMTLSPNATTQFTHKDGGPVSIVVQQELSSTMDRQMIERSALAAGASAAGVRSVAPAHWKLMVKHPSGSLEAYVNAARRR